MNVKFWGEFALFTRPEYKSEPHTYPVMTFTAAKGLLESIFWKPEIKYFINSIRVLNKIDYLPIKRNMIKSKQNPKITNYIASEDRTQRNCIVLKNVAYIVDFDFDLQNDDQNHDKYYAMINERIKAGQCFKQPYFGCREYIAYFEFPSGDESLHLSLLGKVDLGVMPKEIHFVPDKKGNISWKSKDTITNGKTIVEFKHFEMVDGVVRCLEN
jgi:CRISPR-associated protein Cas5d